MITRLIPALALAALAVLPAAASAAPVDVTSKPLVYVFVVDGLDGDRVDQGRAPFLGSLIKGENGARSTYYQESRSIMVAETNPNHLAMASGAYGGNSGLPGNSFAVYGQTPSSSSCAAPMLDESKPPTIVSGESPTCVQVETFFEAVARQSGAEEITTAGIFGKPKLGRIFAARKADGGKSFDADFLFAPCEGSGGPGPDSGDSINGSSGNPSYCREVATNPVTGTSRDDAVIMDEVLRTVRDGVPADGQTKRPNLTFVNFATVDQSGHATGAGVAYDQATAMADAQLRRFVDQQKQLGLWERTAMIVLSDHSMDSTPEKTSLGQRYTAAGISSSDYKIVQNGSAALVYLNDRTRPDRFNLLQRLRQASLSPLDQMGLTGVNEALYREANPADGGDANTLGRVHPDYKLVGPRTGDLVITHNPNGAFSDPINPLAGNHGGPQTRDNTFAVIGGSDLVRQQSLAGQAARPGFDDTAANPGQAENVDVAPTVMRLLGRAAPAQNSGRFLAEAFNLSQLPKPPVALPRLRITVNPARTRSGRSTRFRFTVTGPKGSVLPPRIDCTKASRRKGKACTSQAGGSPVEAALVRFAGRTGRTNAAGQVTIVRKLRQARRFSARATRSGFRAASTRVTVIRAQRRGGNGGGRPRFTG